MNRVLAGRSAVILLEHRARHLIDHPHPHRAAIRRGCNERGQLPARRDGETRPNLGQRWRAGAFVRDQLLRARVPSWKPIHVKAAIVLVEASEPTDLYCPKKSKPFGSCLVRR